MFVTKYLWSDLEILGPVQEDKAQNIIIHNHNLDDKF